MITMSRPVEHMCPNCVHPWQCAGPHTDECGACNHPMAECECDGADSTREVTTYLAVTMAEYAATKQDDWQDDH